MLAGLWSCGYVAPPTSLSRPAVKPGGKKDQNEILKWPPHPPAEGLGLGRVPGHFFFVFLTACMSWATPPRLVVGRSGPRISRVAMAWREKNAVSVQKKNLLLTMVVALLKGMAMRPDGVAKILLSLVTLTTTLYYFSPPKSIARGKASKAGIYGAPNAEVVGASLAAIWLRAGVSQWSQRSLKRGCKRWGGQIGFVRVCLTTCHLAHHYCTPPTAATAVRLV